MRPTLVSFVVFGLFLILAKAGNAQGTSLDPQGASFDPWDGVRASRPGAHLVIETRARRACDFESADAVSITCVQHLHAPYGEVSMPITISRALIREIDLDTSRRSHTESVTGDPVADGALSGGSLGFLIGASVKRDGQAAVLGALTGAVAGGVLAAAARRHPHLLTIYVAP